MSTTPYDDAFKELAERDAAALLLLLGAILPDEEVTIELLSRELRAAKQIADQPYLLRSVRGERIVHAEAQTYYQGNEPGRLLDYGLYLWLSQKKQYPVESYLLILTRQGVPAEPPTSHTVVAGSLQLTVNFHVICLWQFPAVEALNLERAELLPFVPLMAGGLAELEQAAQRITQISDEQQRGTLALNLLALSSLRYTEPELIALFGKEPMIQELVKETPWYINLVNKTREEGLAGGLAKGLAEGRAEGRAEVLQEALAAYIELLRFKAGQRFPGLQLGSELAQIHDLAALKLLLKEFDQVPDEAALQQYLAALTHVTNGA